MPELIITAIGANQPGIIQQLSEHLQSHQLNILDSRMSALGGEFAILLLAEGEDDAIATLEHSIQQAGLPLQIHTSPARAATPTTSRPYRVEIMAVDRPGIVHDVSHYLSGLGINIETFDTNHHRAAYSGVKMFTITMTISLPATLTLREFQHGFDSFCDQHYLDMIMEPLR
jgi:glycine cleavage system transcriptional repressor